MFGEFETVPLKRRGKQCVEDETAATTETASFPKRAKRQDTARTLRVKEELKESPYRPSLDFMPEFLRYGPWSPFAWLFLALTITGIVYYYPVARETMNHTIPGQESDSMSVMIRAVIVCYLCFVTGYVYKYTGIWAFYSFTMMSWNLLTARYLCTSFGLIPSYICENLRFPSVCCNVITVSIWWCILVPLIVLYLDSSNARKAFIAFNFKFTLLNIHLLNLPLAIYDHLALYRSLTYFDLWCAIVIAVLYVLFYLFVMDPFGLHFYHFILSPRPHWCFVLYAAAMSLFWLIFQAFKSFE